MSGNFSEHRNGKPAPKDIGDWINLQASPKVWICGLALTLAENWPRHSHFLGRRLTEDGSGPHLPANIRDARNMAKRERRIVIILRNGRYRYLSPPEAVGIPRT